MLKILDWFLLVKIDKGIHNRYQALIYGCVSKENYGK